jgi:hypothetical protein
MTRREIALLVTLGLLAVYSYNANATGGGSNVPSYTVNTFADGGTSVSAAQSRATAGSSASAMGGAATAAGGSGGSASVVVNAGSGSGSSRRVEVRSVGIAPDMIASPTAPCRVAIGAGGGWVGNALSIFGSVLDEGCDTREDSRHLNNIGKIEASVRRLCAKKEMAAALGEVDCPKPATEER